MQFNSSVPHHMMENDIFSLPIDMAGRNPIVIDGIPSHSTSNSLVQSSTFDLNNQNQIMSGYPVLSALQGEHIGAGFVDSGAFVSRSLPPGRNAIRDGSLINSHSNDYTEFQEQFMGGTPISATTLANLLATRSGLHEDLNDIAVSAPSVLPSEVFRTYVSNDCSNTSNSSFATAANCEYDGVHGDMNNKWDFNNFLAPLELAGKPSERTRFQQIHFMGNLDPNGWISSNNANVTTDHPYGSSKFRNELSLSLSTSQPSIIFGTAIPDQCSEINCSGVTRHYLNETGLGSDQTSCNSKELSLSFGSYRPAQFPQVISGSRYLRVIQEILAEIASYSLENHDQMRYSTGRIGAGASIPFSSSWPTERGTSLMGSDKSTEGGGGEVQMEPFLQRQEVEVKKTQLLALLQVVDERYNQCLDEVHTVTSAFHAATELDPQIHARFALQTISFLYKNLRERISNQILTMGSNFKSGCTGENEGAFETSFIQKQWALQQLKRKDHQLWRPQRGLPERSVSVLRAWMFQNFLHPYPKDAEKHLLAVKSGLTRSQVSNWFINARVRLWKPMIEEMYSEMNSRKARRNDEGTDNHHHLKSHVSIDNQRFKMN